MVQGRTGSGNVVPLMVRVPEDLRDRIKAAADANGRSQNSEIVRTLEEKYPAPSALAEDLQFLIEFTSRQLEDPTVQRDLSQKLIFERSIEKLRKALQDIKPSYDPPKAEG